MQKLMASERFILPPPYIEPGEHANQTTLRSTTITQDSDRDKEVPAKQIDAAQNAMAASSVVKDQGATAPILVTEDQGHIDVRKFLELWTVTWEKAVGSSGDFESYFALYADNFHAYGGGGKKEWRQSKTQKNLKKEKVQISLSHIQISSINAGNWLEVSFVQNYNSSNYSDISEKVLVLEKTADKWKIISESSQ